LGRDFSLLMRGSALATRLALAAIGGFALSGESLAGTLDWDTVGGNGSLTGGPGAWDSSIANTNWRDVGAGSNVNWSAGSVARFGGAGGDVTVTGVQVIGGLIFTGSGYNIKASDPASALQIDNPSTDFTVTNAANTATISAAVTGLGGIEVKGPGTLVLSGANTYSGLTSITNNGTLRVNGGSIVGGISVTFGRLFSDGVISGGLTNIGSAATLQGTVDGGIVNSGGGINIVGNLQAGGVMSNTGNSVINISAGTTSGVTALTNASTQAAGVTVGVSAGLSVDSITNSSGATIVNNGALTVASLFDNSGNLKNNSTGAISALDFTNAQGATISNSGALATTNGIKNAGSVTNSATGTITGGIVSSGTVNSAGAISGGVANTGTFASTGDLNGGLTNSGNGKAAVRGSLGGNILNDGSGALTINGNLAATAALLTNNGTATIAITAGTTTGVTALANNSKASAGLTVSVSAALSADSIANSSGATIVNNGTLSATGLFQNNGKLQNNINNNVKGAISALDFTNAQGAAISNSGTLATTNGIKNAGSVNNAATGAITGGIINSGTVDSAGAISGGVANTGLFASTGVFNGGLANSGNGIATVRGSLGGNILNEGLAALTMNGNLVATNTLVTNKDSATIAVTAGTTTGITALSNSSNAAVGVSIAKNAMLSADDVSNAAGSVFYNGGTLLSKNVILNGGVLNNDTAGTISGGIANAGSLYSFGTLTGAVANTGTLLSTGTLDGVLTNGSLTNAGTASISGIVKGAIVNQNSSSLTITGALDAKNNTLTNTGAATVAVTAGATTGISALTNSSTASVGVAVGKDAKLSADKISNAAGSAIYNGGTLASGTVIQNSGAISNDTAGIINGGINNIGGLNSLGTINGDIANSGGFNNFGTVNGALTVSAGGSLGGAGGTLASLLLDGGAMAAGSSQTVKGDTTQNAGSVMAGSIIGPGAGLYLMTGGSLTGSVSKYGSFVQEGGNLAAGSNISVDAFGSTGGTDSGANITAHLRAVALDGKIGPLSVAQSNISNNVGGISFVSDGVTTLGSAGVTAVTTVTKAAGPTDIVVNAGMTGFRGIDAAALGGGAISIKTVGPIVTASTAISMQTAGGAGVAEVLGNVSVSGADAAFVGGGNATFNIGNGVTVKAAGLLNSVSGQTTLKNAGTVEAQSLSSGGGGSVVVDNLTSGIVNLGGISLSNFAGANDAFNNSGILNAAGTVTLAGLENFSNLSTGIISLGNGVGGDKLLLGGNLNLGASQVFMDVDLSQSQNAAVNDIIILDGTHGVLSGNGAVLHLNDTSKSVPNIGFVGPTLIRGASIDPGSTFVITGLSDAGFFEYGLVQNGGNLDLSSKIREQVAGGIVSNFITAQNAVSSAFFKPSSSFVSTPVNPEPNQFGFAPWFRTSGGLSRIGSQGVAILPSGTAQSVASSVNVGFGGYQFGMDTGLFNIAGKGGNVHIGLTAGQIFGSATQVGYNNKTGMTDTFVGAYGVFSNGPFFVDALLRQEFIDYTVNVDDLLFRIDGAKVKAKRFSAGVSGGYAFKLNDWSIVPAAGYTYARTTTGDLNIVGNGTSQSSVITSFADTESHLAFAGISASRSFLLFDDKLRLSPFISATAYHDFGKANEAQLKVVSSPGNSSTFDVSSRNGATYGEVSLGANFLALTPKFGGAERLLSGNIRGDVQFGKERLGGSLNMQMRLQF
jgi:uncharacterized protein YhjY with autotransporter beta-barrel domain